jgi:uncharacterized protein (TIGR00255 family)
MLSMTGFAQKNLSMEITFKDNENKLVTSNVDLLVTIKSVNSRYFESTCRIPSVINSWETDIIRFLKAKIVRGQVYFVINPDNNQLKNSLTPSMNIIKQYLDLAAELKRDYQLDNLSINTLLTLPNVFSTGEKETTEKEKEIFLKKLEELVNNFNADRKREGDNLKADLLERCSVLKEIIDKIEPEANRAHAEQKKKVGEYLAQVNNHEEKSTLLLLMDKLDLHEEITRFNSHLKNFKAIVNDEKISKGKELDFVLQEMFREINTIGSKTNSYFISNNTVNAKVELEKAREQVQNIV